MKVTSRFPLNIRHKVFLASYKLRLVFPNGAIGYVGRGSVNILKNINCFNGEVPDHPLVTIGNFCESAEGRILLDGEHRNNKIFNQSLGTFPILREALKAQSLVGWRSFAKAETVIGHGCILGKDVTILSGAKIGDGVVIGAGSVVVGSIPDFSLAAGNPCRPLRTRLSAEQVEMAQDLRWWEFDIGFFYDHLPELFDIESNYKHLKKCAIYDSDEHTVVINYKRAAKDGAPTEISVLGVEVKGCFYPLGDLPEIKTYFSQMYKPEDALLTWVPNIFSAVAGG